MRMKMAMTGLGFAALAAAGAAQAQITPKGNAYLFRAKYTKGQKLQYEMDASTTAPGTAPGGGAFKMKMNMALEVLDVQNGIATVKTTSDGGALNGKAAGKGNATTMKVGNRGQIIGGNGAANFGPTLPENPIKIGDTFTMQGGGLAGGQGGAGVKTTYRLIGFKTYRGQKVAQIAVSNVANGEFKSNSNGSLLLSMADGQIVSMSLDSQSSINGGQGKTMNLVSHVKMDRK